MKTELEARYYPIDVTELESQLARLPGATWYGELWMDRVVYDIDIAKRKFLRLRREKNITTHTIVTTITLKEINDISSVSGTLEHEIKLEGDQFAEARYMLKSLGFKPVSHQENKRRQWHYKNVKIFIDYWPRLRPLVEIEASHENEIVALYCNELRISREEFHKIKRLEF
jgi:predicted adenylyl cyclase CyaB